VKIEERWRTDAQVVLYPGDTRDLLSSMPDAVARLIITSPPYNLAKEYEGKRVDLDEYLRVQREVIQHCVRILEPGGSLCWQVGNHIAGDEIVPLDLVLYPIFREHQGDLKLRNRIVWHFEHGLHCRRRFSGRYEVILWYTKGNDYRFDLDAVRVPQKYPGKRAWKGPRAGEYTSNPLGKNPGDVWVFPNVKANHVEKTVHPCQFPVELVERFILAVTEPGDLVVDPFMGVGTTACAAVLHQRRTAGAEMVPSYIEIAKERLRLAIAGELKTRPMDRPVHRPNPDSALVRRDESAPSNSGRARKRTPAQGLVLTTRAIGAERPEPSQMTLLPDDG
jgi:adenine-specific DNA-methyltransferase